VLAALPDSRVGGASGAASKGANGLAPAHAELSGLVEQLREWAEARKRAFGAPERGRSGRLPPGLLRLHQGDGNLNPALVALTGSAPGSGVSTVAGGLAARLAKDGLKVLLVDARTSGGLAANRRNGTNGHAAVRHWAMDLSVLRDAVQMDAAMWELRSKGSGFDFVVLDLPDLSSSRAAAQVAALCDGALLVVGANKTRWQVAMHAKERLLEARVNLLGAVINRREYPIPQWLYRTL
jgi:Mrp family chromosome partitioning ATPase